MIFNGSDPNVKDKFGNTPLHILLKNINQDFRNQMKEFLNILVENKFDFFVKNDDDESPFYHLITNTSFSFESVHQALVRSIPNSKSDLENKFGEIFLHVFLKKGNRKFPEDALSINGFFQDITELKFFDINSKDNSGTTAFMASCNFEHHYYIMMIWKKFSSTLKVNEQDNSGK